MSYRLWQYGGVMKSLTRMFQDYLRSNRRPVYQQLELPLHGTRLRPEDWRTVQSLSRLREKLATGEI
jgi:hypothetical protein